MNYTTPQVVAEIERQITDNYNGENTSEIVRYIMEVIARNYLNLDDVPNNFVTLNSSGQSVFLRANNPIKAVGVDGDIWLFVEAATALLRLYNKINGNWVLIGVPIGGNIIAGTNTIFTASYNTTAADYQSKCGGGTGASVVRSASSVLSLSDAEDAARIRAIDAIVCSIPASGVYTGSYSTTPDDYLTVCGYAGNQQITKIAYSTIGQIDANAKAKVAAIAGITCSAATYSASYTTTAADYFGKCGNSGSVTITKNAVSGISQADANEKAKGNAISAISCAVVTTPTTPTVNITPDPPTVNFDTATRILSASDSDYGTNELEYRHNSGTVLAYASIGVDDAAHNANEWQYRVKAATGRNASAWAGNAAIAAKTAAITKLAAPTLSQPANVTATTATLSWTPVTGAYGYLLVRATDAAFTQNVTTVYASTGTSYTDTGLTQLIGYYWDVVAEGTGNYSNSDASTAVSATTLATPATASTAEAPFTMLDMVRLDVAGATINDVTTTPQAVTWKTTAADGTVGLNNVGGTIAIRGNSTALQPEKPFKMALAAKATPFGLLSDDTFNGLRPWFDVTMLKNPTFFTLARALDLTAPKGRFANTYDDNGYNGFTFLTERPKTAIIPNYVKATTVLAANSLTWVVQKVADYQEDLTTLKYFKTPLIGAAANYFSNINSNVEHSISIETPKPADITDAQFNDIKNYVLAAELSLAQSWDDLVNGPQAYFDRDSFLDSALFEEGRKDVDSGSQSEYWYKNPGEKLKRMVWDCDASAPYNALFGVPADVQQWWGPGTPWLGLAYNSSAAFRRDVKARWVTRRNQFAKAVDYFQKQGAVLLSSNTAQMQVAAWGAFGGSYSTDRSAGMQGYTDNVAACKQWLIDRFNALDTLYPSLSEYNPFFTVPARYNYHSTLFLSSIVVDANRRVTLWKDASPFAYNPLVANVVGDDLPLLNLNVDGYPALEIGTGNRVSNAFLQYLNARNNIDITIALYVKSRFDGVNSFVVYNEGIEIFQVGPQGAKYTNQRAGAVAASTTPTNLDWATIIFGGGASGTFMMVNGVNTPGETNGETVGVNTILTLFRTGALHIRHFSTYERVVAQSEATFMHQKMVAEFPAVAVAARFATPVISEVSAANYEPKFLRFVKDSSVSVTEYGLTYDGGYSFVQMPASYLANGVFDIPLPNAVYSPRTVGIKIFSTLLKPESLVSLNTAVLGAINYLFNGDFSQGSNGWENDGGVQFVGTNNVQFPNNGFIQQYIYFANNTLPTGANFKFVVRGTGSFYLSLYEDNFSAGPNVGFDLANNETKEFAITLQDVTTHNFKPRLDAAAGSYLTLFQWTVA